MGKGEGWGEGEGQGNGAAEAGQWENGLCGCCSSCRNCKFSFVLIIQDNILGYTNIQTQILFYRNRIISLNV